jgi:hypothetical protein
MDWSQTYDTCNRRYYCKVILKYSNILMNKITKKSSKTLEKPIKNLRKLVLMIETYREIFNPPRNQREILRKAEKQAQAILLKGNNKTLGKRK